MDEEPHAGSVTVHGAAITTFSFQTNGFHGGDGGHGGYLEIVIDGGPSTMMSIALDGAPMPAGGEGDHKIAIRFVGDSEMENMAKGLEFLAANIRQALQRSDHA